MRDTFVRTLIALANENPNIRLVTGDLGFGVLKPFWEQLPNQFVNAGIAEQNMTSVAAGMALEGKIVFTYSIGNFPTLRCLEQIRNDCAYHNANVKICNFFHSVKQSEEQHIASHPDRFTFCCQAAKRAQPDILFVPFPYYFFLADEVRVFSIFLILSSTPVSAASPPSL